MADHERIWLQPKCCAGEYDGRQWCQDNVFDDGMCEDGNKATEYVRADLLLALEADKAALVEALGRAIDLIEDAEKDTNWTSGDPYGDSAEVELSATLAKHGGDHDSIK